MAGNNGGPWGGGGGNSGGDRPNGGNRGSGGGGQGPGGEGPQIPEIDELVKKGQERLRVLMGGKGGPTILVHHICHKEIHAALSEAELARDYASAEALRSHPQLAKFFAWVAKRPPDFMSRVPKRSGRRRR